MKHFLRFHVPRGNISVAVRDYYTEETPGGSLIQARPWGQLGTSWAWKVGLRSTGVLGRWEECKYPEDTRIQLLGAGLGVNWREKDVLSSWASCGVSSLGLSCQSWWHLT